MSMRVTYALLISLAGTLAVPAQAFDFRAADGPVFPIPAARPAEMTMGPERICTLIRNAAAAHGLPADFFARLIWKESRFDIRALSPAGAQGIAQFMPQTAKIRGLKRFR